MCRALRHVPRPQNRTRRFDAPLCRTLRRPCAAPSNRCLGRAPPRTREGSDLEGRPRLSCLSCAALASRLPPVPQICAARPRPVGTGLGSGHVASEYLCVMLSCLFRQGEDASAEPQPRAAVSRRSLRAAVSAPQPRSRGRAIGACSRRVGAAVGACFSCPRQRPAQQPEARRRVPAGQPAPQRCHNGSAAAVGRC